MLIQVQFIVIPLLLVMSAFFAGSEAALFSLSRSQLEWFGEHRPSVHRRIWSLITRPDALLSTFIIGMESVNIAMGTLMVGLLEAEFSRLPDEWIAFISILICSFLQLTISEILPKVLAFRMPVLLSSILVYPVGWFHVVFTPFRKIFLGLSNILIRVAGIKSAPPSPLSEKDLLTLVEVGADSGSLDREEKELIFNVFSFSDLNVGSIMTPWSKVFSLPEELVLDEILERLKARSLSRVPVVAKRDGRVLGILYSKELIKMLLTRGPRLGGEVVKEATFPPYFVTTQKKVSLLFREFRQKKVHFAIVVDEYGKQLGIVTLDDILNALFKIQKRTEESRIG